MVELKGNPWSSKSLGLIHTKVLQMALAVAGSHWWTENKYGF